MTLMKSVCSACAICSALFACTNSNAPATCSAPGAATPGPADDHCSGQPTQPVSQASCHSDASAPLDDAGADAGPTNTCEYGDTMFGQVADDDDCKYHVSWT